MENVVLRLGHPPSRGIDSDRSQEVNTSVLVHMCNLDERVTDRVLYDILIQAGRVADLHIPRDRETNKSKGYAFAEYETEEIADYAVKLFSGLVTLYNRTLRFAISGQDKPSSNIGGPITPSSSSFKSSLHPVPDYRDISSYSSRFSPHLSSHQQDQGRIR